MARKIKNSEFVRLIVRQKLFFIFIFLTLFSAGKIHPQKLESVSANYPQLTNIPTLYINTTNLVPITSKDNYVPGTLVAVSTDYMEVLLGSGSGVDMEIRGRGHSTWSMPKKPYRIKFASKTKFLNLPANAKSWTLMANYADKSLIRNAVAGKISELIGMDFTPAAKFVDLILNGEYVGNYMVSDQVQVNPNRVEIDEQDGTITTLPDLSGGYLLEIDGFAYGEPVWFATGRGLPITIKSPDSDVINQAQKDYIVNFTQRFEDALYSSNFKDPDLGYRALVDTTSLINWYIGCELSGNSDAFWSTYIYKKRNIDKFFWGPMWDYDIAFNNDLRLGDATEKMMREHAHDPKPWIQRMWEDEWFRGAVYRRWMQLIEKDKIIDKLLSFIDETATLIDASQQKNYQFWGNIGNRVYLEQNLFDTYSENVAYLKTYLNSRSKFLTQRFSSNEPILTFPDIKLSTLNNTDEHWYYLNTPNRQVTGCLIADIGTKGSSTVLTQTQAQTKGDSKLLWKIVEESPDNYWIINKATGNYINYGKAAGFNANKFSAGPAACTFEFLRWTGGSPANCWRFKCNNGGVSEINKELGGATFGSYYGPNDPGNAIRFFAEDSPEADLFLPQPAPEFSSNTNEFWYRIAFVRSGKVIEETGFDQTLEQKLTADKPAQYWKFTGTYPDAVKVESYAGNEIRWNGDADRFVSYTKGDPSITTFTLQMNSAGSHWMLKNNADNNFVNDYGATGQIVGRWHVVGDPGSILLFTKVPAKFNVSTSELNFDETVVDDTTLPLSVDVSIVRTFPTMEATYSITGTDAAAFTFDTSIVWKTDLGGKLGITFTPAAAKTYNATLEITANGETKTVALSGTGKAYVDVITPADNDPVVSVKYYNLLGVEMTNPHVQGVYIVKKTYASGKTQTVKQLMLVK